MQTIMRHSPITCNGPMFHCLQRGGFCPEALCVAVRGRMRAARVASLHTARAERGQHKKHTHNAQNARSAQHGVPEASLEADFRHAQNA